MSGNLAMSPFDHPEDICQCGDYRKQHEDEGYGACKICRWNGPIRCEKFRLSQKYKGKRL